jgi:hypothetical protein
MKTFRLRAGGTLIAAAHLAGYLPERQRLVARRDTNESARSHGQG